MAPVKTADARVAGRATRRKAKRSSEVFAVYGALVLLLILGAVLSPSFLSSFNLQSIIQAAAALALVSIGQTFVVLTGGIDLSVGSMMSLTTVLAAFAMNGSDGRLLSAVVLSIAVGIGIGLANGLAVTALRVSPIIATLGMMSVIQGLTFARSMRPGGIVAPWLTGVAYGQVGPVPTAAFVIAAAFVLAAVVLRRTRYGQHVYAVGGSEEVARLSGIATQRVKLSVYVVSSVCSALAGLMLTSRLGQGDPLSGQAFMLTSVAAVAIGGTSLFGGRGGVSGTLAGVLILTVLANALNLRGISTYPQQLITGLLIIGVVAIYSAARTPWGTLMHAARVRFRERGMKA